MTAPAAPTATTGPAPVPRARAIAVQAAFDLRLLLRNGEQILLTILIPVVLLVGLSSTRVVSIGDTTAPGSTSSCRGSSPWR